MDTKPSFGRRFCVLRWNDRIFRPNFLFLSWKFDNPYYHIVQLQYNFFLRRIKGKRTFTAWGNLKFSARSTIFTVIWKWEFHSEIVRLNQDLFCKDGALSDCLKDTFLSEDTDVFVISPNRQTFYFPEFENLILLEFLGCAGQPFFEFQSPIFNFFKLRKIKDSYV